MFKLFLANVHGVICFLNALTVVPHTMAMVAPLHVVPLSQHVVQLIKHLETKFGKNCIALNSVTVGDSMDPHLLH